MYGAEPLNEAKFPYIYNTVRELCLEYRIPMPKLWYLKTEMANAFATGRNPAHASVAVTQGIMDLLEPHELRGVLAHEISHIKNRDVLVATIAATLATTIGYLADMLQWSLFWGRNDREEGGTSMFGAILTIIFMPLAAMLIQFAISRSREYLADETGANCCHDPLALASALEKLQDQSHYRTRGPVSHAEQATASLFFVYPFSGKGMLSWFSTHPPLEKRIARLRKMAGIR
jgi:heat shock protein HtpX